LRCSLYGTDDGKTVYLNIPSNRRLVIEFIAGNISTAGPADNIGEAYIVVYNASKESETFFIDIATPRPWRHSGSAPGFITIFNKNVLINAYSSGDEYDVALYCNRTTREQDVDYVVTLVGHLEPL
ncbi:MAG: hypothetical protein ABI618_16570, partial [Nitrospirota bacterium]